MFSLVLGNSCGYLEPSSVIRALFWCHGVSTEASLWASSMLLRNTNLYMSVGSLTRLVLMFLFLSGEGKNMTVQVVVSQVQGVQLAWRNDSHNQTLQFGLTPLFLPELLSITFERSAGNCFI